MPMVNSRHQYQSLLATRTVYNPEKSFNAVVMNPYQLPTAHLRLHTVGLHLRAAT